MTRPRRYHKPIKEDFSEALGVIVKISQPKKKVTKDKAKTKKKIDK